MPAMVITDGSSILWFVAAGARGLQVRGTDDCVALGTRAEPTRLEGSASVSALVLAYLPQSTGPLGPDVSGSIFFGSLLPAGRVAPTRPSALRIALTS